MGLLTQLSMRCRIAAEIEFACLSLGIEGANAQTNRPPTIVTVCAPCHGVDGTTGDVEKPNLAGRKEHIHPPAALGLSNWQA